MTGPHLVPAPSERDHAAGPDDAPVTLVEYGDYECPHCGRAHPIVKRLQAALGARLRFVYRNFPLKEIHPHAEHAAEVAAAAGEQGAFWPVHDAMFEHQHALDDASLLRYAEDAGIDAERVASELAAGSHAGRVREDFRSGVRSGVNGTPTFFVNGTRYDGNWTDPEEFAADLEDAARDG